MNDFGNRWCKREGVEDNALKEWKRSIFTIVDKRKQFYSQNTNLLPPKPKSSFRHLKQGIQEFHRKYVLVPADKAANNVVVVCRLHYVNTLKQELDGTRAYLETDTDEVSVVNAHLNDLPVKFLFVSMKAKTNFLRCIGYLSFTKDHTKHRLLAEKGPAPPPLGNFADIVYLKEQSFLIQMRDVCTLYAGA